MQGSIGGPGKPERPEKTDGFLEEEDAEREESFFVCDGCGEAAAGEVCYAVELGSFSLRFCRECLREKRSLAEHLDMLGAEVRRC